MVVVLVHKYLHSSLKKNTKLILPFQFMNTLNFNLISWLFFRLNWNSLATWWTWALCKQQCPEGMCTLKDFYLRASSHASWVTGPRGCTASQDLQYVYVENAQHSLSIRLNDAHAVTPGCACVCNRHISVCRPASENGAVTTERIMAQHCGYDKCLELTHLAWYHGKSSGP